jgi:Cu2+-exporting ATPase
MPKKLTFEQVKVACHACVSPIEEKLKQHAHELQITHYLVNVENKTLRVWISDENTDDEIILENKIRALLKDKLPVQGQVSRPNTKSSRKVPPPPPPKKYHFLQAMLGLFTGGLMMTLMLFGIEPSGSLHWIHHAMIWAGAALTAAIGWPSFKHATEALFGEKPSLNMDVLFVISGLAAIALSLAHSFHAPLPMLIDAALMIFGFRHLGQWLEESLTRKTTVTRKFVDSAREDHPNFEEYEVGDIIDVPAGKHIPLNGILTSDTAEISFTLFNGKIEPQIYEIDDELCAGMVAHSDLKMQITRNEEDSYLNFRDNQLELAQAQKAPIQDLTQKIINWFIPGVLLSAAALGLAAYSVVSPLVGLKAALYLLTCACPCALGLITAMAVKFGLTKIPPETGLSFNTAKGLQAAAEVDMVVFDLNGTLTQNKPRVMACTIPEDYFSIIDQMESQSRHPIATAIRSSTNRSKKILPLKIKKFRHGLIASDGDNIYQIGNAEFMNPPADKTVSDPGNAQHVIYFSKNGIIQGNFFIEDPLRDDATLMVHNLIKNNLKFKIFTGSDRSTANQYAKQLKIDPRCITTDCTPESKCSEIQALQYEGHKVAMFGDSGNDVNAIATANLGVAVFSPASHPMSEQAADVSLNNPSLLPVLDIFAVGRQTMGLIKQNLALSFAYNAASLAFVAYAIFAYPALLNPIFGAALMVAQSAFVILNAYRIKCQAASLPEVVGADELIDTPEMTSKPALNSRRRHSWSKIDALQCEGENLISQPRSNNPARSVHI